MVNMAAILEVVENQIREDDPPDTRQTLERLVAAGYSRKQAIEMIGSTVVEEIWARYIRKMTVIFRIHLALAQVQMSLTLILIPNASGRLFHKYSG